MPSGQITFLGCRFLGHRFLGRRFLGRRFLGRRFLGRCFLGRRFLDTRKILLASSTLRRFLSAVRSYMLHILNSAKGNCLTEKENHTLCQKSDIKSINLRITKIYEQEVILKSILSQFFIVKYQNIIVRNSPAFDHHVFDSSQGR